MSNECPVHDKWRFDKDCTCATERKWARGKMLQESLEKLAKSKTLTDEPDRFDWSGDE